MAPDEARSEVIFRSFLSILPSRPIFPSLQEVYPQTSHPSCQDEYPIPPSQGVILGMDRMCISLGIKSLLKHADRVSFLSHSLPFASSDAMPSSHIIRVPNNPNLLSHRFPSPALTKDGSCSATLTPYCLMQHVKALFLI
jgi:hypothetical protein